MLTFSTPLADIENLIRFAPKLRKLGIETIRDLLYHFPARYEDFSEVYRIADLEPGQHATVQGIVEEIDSRRSWRKNFIIIEAKIADESGTVRAIWFNQPYVKNILKPGRLVNFSGKVSVSDEDVYLSNPTYEIVTTQAHAEEIAHSSAPTLHTARLVPVYPETKGLTSKGIRFVVQPILNGLTPLRDFLPETVRAAHRLPDLETALRRVHFPARIEEAEQAKRRFAFEDLFLLQLSNLKQKLRLKAESSPALPVDLNLFRQVLKDLPFELTESQKRSLWEILQDMEKPRPMNRLLQGDVGSGKTAVAALAAAVAADHGYGAAIMAPTEVLARQHYETFKKLFGGLTTITPPSLALLTGSQSKLLYGEGLEREISKAALRQEIQKGKVRIVIGTNALIAGGAKQKPLTFPRLGLVVIDEQHRFGVEQRAQFAHRTSHIPTKKRGASSAAGHSPKLLPHFLSMSATPIPRTLMLTMFGDLDISTIDELPRGRKEIVTKLVAKENRAKAYGFIKAAIKQGRQVFVICPRIEPPDAEEIKNSAAWRQQTKLWEVKSVREEYERLAKKIFPEFSVAILHGQLKPAEKGATMKEFREGRIDVLVSTSVIEVGVDVPNATIMMIEGSERFGLAQLYQFRGRVGRGEHQSFCLLFTDSDSLAAKQRLTAIVTAKNGFELAERDLALRGPGEFLGQRQTGLPDTAMRGLQSPELIRESRAAAVELMRTDPALAGEPLLREKLAEFEGRVHLE